MGLQPCSQTDRCSDAASGASPNCSWLIVAVFQTRPIHTEAPRLHLDARDADGRLHRCGHSSQDNSISVHISHLRRKLGAAIIETRRGMGYRLAD